MDYLPLQIARFDNVRIHDPDRSHAGRCQVQEGGRAEASRSDAQHLRVQELQLAFFADVGKDQMAGVTVAL